MAACQLVPQAVMTIRRTPQLLRREIQAAELGRCSVKVQAAAHGVRNGLGLLEDFLQHVVGIAARVDVARFEFQRVDPRIDVSGVAMIDPHGIGRKHGQFMIGKVDNLVGIARQRRGITGDEVLAVANAQYDRTAQAGDDEHFRPIAEENRQTVGSLELGEGLFHGGDQWTISVGRHVFHGSLPLQTTCDQVGDHLGIGRGMEPIALGNEATLERIEVFNHAIMDDGDFSGATQMGMRIDVTWGTMGSPARMSDARSACRRRGCEVSL